MAEIINGIADILSKKVNDSKTQYTIFFDEAPPAGTPDFKCIYYEKGFDNEPFVNVDIISAVEVSSTVYQVTIRPPGFSGDIDIVATWKDTVNSNPVTRIRDCLFEAGTPVNTPSTLQENNPPQISVAIAAGGETNTTAAAPSPLDATHLESIINDIYSRMNTGIGPAWENGGYTYYSTIPTDAIELEECWAQQISSMISFAPYYGPDWAYGFGGKEKTVFEEYDDDTDPGYPIFLACQHLCDMALLTRGINLTNGFLIGATGCDQSFKKIANDPAFKAKGARYISDLTYNHLGNAISMGAPGKSWTLTPGSVYGKQGHTAFLLRVFSNARNAQYLDTAAMHTTSGEITDDKKKYLRKLAGRREKLGDASKVCPGNHDYSFINHTKLKRAMAVDGKEANYKGLLIPPQVSVSELTTAIDKARIARPLGIARLLLKDRSSGNKVIWASPMLPMWEKQSSKVVPFTLTLLAWSLRNHLYHESVEACWQIDAPTKDLFTLIKSQKSSFAFKGYDSGNVITDRKSFLDISSRSNGEIEFPYLVSLDVATNTDSTRGSRTPSGLVLGGRGTKVIADGLDVDNTKIPAYFRGDFPN